MSEYLKPRQESAVHSPRWNRLRQLSCCMKSFLTVAGSGLDQSVSDHVSRSRVRMPRVGLVTWHHSLAPCCCEAFTSPLSQPQMRPHFIVNCTGLFYVAEQSPCPCLDRRLSFGLSPFLDSSPSAERELCGSVEVVGAKRW